jgi:hypothetical protein
MEYLNEVKIWLNSPYVDQQTRNELLNAMENRADMADRFYKDLEFGTAGLRGIMGAGRNRMNIYTVGRATQGLANYILSFGDRYRERGVVIAYDTRHGSKLYALRTALVLAGNGVKAYLFDGHRPTPELSYAIRCLGAVLVSKLFGHFCHKTASGSYIAIIIILLLGSSLGSLPALETGLSFLEECGNAFFFVLGGTGVRMQV